METRKLLKSPLNDILTIIDQPKQLNNEGLQEIIDFLNFDLNAKLNKKDTKLIKIINRTFSAGVDEGVKECLGRLMRYPGFKEFVEKNTSIE